MSISTRFLLPALLSALIGGLPIAASAENQIPLAPRGFGNNQGAQPQPGPQYQGNGAYHGAPRGNGGYNGNRGYYGNREYQGNRGYYGPRRHYRDDGADAAVAAGILGLAVGAMAAGAARGDSHVRWCLRHYRSYDPDTDTYVGRDGRRHYCR